MFSLCSCSQIISLISFDRKKSTEGGVTPFLQFNSKTDEEKSFLSDSIDKEIKFRLKIETSLEQQDNALLCQDGHSWNEEHQRIIQIFEHTKEWIESTLPTTPPTLTTTRPSMAFSVSQSDVQGRRSTQKMVKIDEPYLLIDIIVQVGRLHVSSGLLDETNSMAFSVLWSDDLGRRYERKSHID